MTPLNQMHPSQATMRLTQIVQQAYHRKSRQLPANLSEIVDTFKGDLLKYLPSVPIETVDEAVIFEVLHDDKTPFSPSFLFQAVRKHYTAPTTQRDMDKGDIYYWTQQLRELENKGLGHTQKAQECRWWINKIHTGDTEQDTVTLLDLIADAAKDPDRPLYFDVRREYYYLVMRKQIALDAFTRFEQQAKDLINIERVKQCKRPLDEFLGESLRDLHTRQMHCAVVEWMRRCNESNAKPSDILTPLMDEQSYRELRKTC